MLAFPNAKINLGLHVLRRRDDGYHDIETVMLPVAWCDALEAVRVEGADAPGVSLSVSGLDIDGAVDDNLCVKAYRILAADYPLPAVRMHLHKCIPQGAGLGGGSSDAAAALGLLDRIGGLALSAAKWHAYAAALGSDCPFFIGGTPVLARGRGDRMAPVVLPLQGWYAVVVKPSCSVSTAAAYAAVIPRSPRRPLAEIIAGPPSGWKDRLVNDFEPWVFRACPEVKQVRDTLYAQGALYASLTGSGSAVYGLFDRPARGRALFPSLATWEGKLA